MAELFANKYRIEPTRLKGWDYSTPGYYFVTICTQNRKCLFGEINNGKMRLNEYGKIVENEWLKTAKLRRNVALDIHQIMPNHIHGIVVMTKWVEKPVGVEAYCNTPLHCNTPLQRGFRSPSNDLGAIIRGFKSTTTRQINPLRGTPGGQVWQRNYYDHIIRDNYSLNRIRQYIIDNPKNWVDDRNNPKNFLKPRSWSKT